MRLLWRRRNHVWCSACGVLGIRAAFAARRHADQAHIRWAHSLLGRSV